MKTAVLGHGVVGRSVCDLITGSDNGIELKWILEIPEKATEPLMTSDINDILDDPEVEVVVDVLPAVHPSYDFMKAAILKKKHVVTSNKAALCFGFKELMDLAMENGVYLRYEASCGGTIPNIAEAISLSETNEILSVKGIMNGTTNYILYNIDKNGTEFDAALKEAQKLGYAERNPAADLSGYDVQNKIVILSNTAYRGYTQFDIPVTGIEDVTKEILDEFKKDGKRIKLLGLSVRNGNDYAMGVVPTVLGRDALESYVPMNFNMISFNASNAGEIKLYGQGAGGVPTADAVMRDVTALKQLKDEPYSRYFVNELNYKPELLMGTGYYGNGITAEGSLEELTAKAKAKGGFFAFEPKTAV